MPMMDAAPETHAYHPIEPEPVTGEAPAEKVVERRRRDYRRLGVLAIGLAVVTALVVLAVLALTANGPGLVPVPDFNGKTIAQARTLAREANLSLKEVPRNGPQRAGTVVSQSIPPNIAVGEGASVTVAVATGKPAEPAGVDVPNVIGKSRASAVDVLESAGFKVEVTTASTSAFDAGTVIGQDPSGAEMAQKGSDVVIVVATRPAERRKKGHKDKD
jgi:serine/threonine-protein kinase